MESFLYKNKILNSLSSKIIFYSALLAFILFSTFFYFFLRESRTYLVDKAIKTVELELASDVKILELFLGDSQNNINFIADTPPLQGMLRAEKNNNIDAQDGSTYQQWINRLTSIFQSEMNVSGYYDQLRYVNDSGHEVVRVNFDRNNNVASSSSVLSYKGDRSYLINTRDLNPGSIFVSDVELNKEGSPPMITKPYVAALRYVVPIFDQETGLRRGSVVANINFDTFLRKIDITSSEQKSIYITDSSGYFLVHDDVTKQWGGINDLNTEINIQNQEPVLTQKIDQTEKGYLIHGDSVFVFNRVYFGTGDEDYWVIIHEQSRVAILGDISRIIAQSVCIIIASFIVLCLMYVYIIRKLLHPLKQLTKVAKNIGQGDFNQKIIIDSGGEIGVLSTAVNLMTHKLKGLYQDLENQVSEQTDLLEVKIKELEDTKKAIMNVLDDAEQGQKDLRLEGEKTKAILSSIGDALVVVDNEGSIILVNKSFTEITGFAESEVLNKKMTKVLPLYGKKGVLIKAKDRPINKALRLRESVSNQFQDIEYKRKNKSLFPVAISISPIVTDGDVIGAVQVFRDTTQEYAIDKAKTEFVSLASHQLRTPLTAINWYTEMLLTDTSQDLNKQQQLYIEEIKNGSNRMVELVNALLNVSRIELGNFAVDAQPQNVRDILGNVIKDMRVLLEGKDVTYSVDAALAPDLYISDRNLLGMIFQNLISNAFKYTQKGQIEIILQEKGAWLEFKVSDTGCGIPKKEQSKIFTKLYRAENVKIQDTTGTGLGLYIIKSIIEEMGGDISFVSEEGGGTTFTVHLPMAGVESKKGSKPLEM